MTKLKDGYGRSTVNGKTIITPPSIQSDDSAKKLALLELSKSNTQPEQQFGNSEQLESGTDKNSGMDEDSQRESQELNETGETSFKMVSPIDGTVSYQPARVVGGVIVDSNTGKPIFSGDPEHEDNKGMLEAWGYHGSH
jgi:hypothetical protein